MAVYRTKAIILRHTDDREHDRSLVVLTPDRGQQRLAARGTKKSVSKLGGSLEPLMEVDLMVAEGRVADRVTGSVVLNRFEQLRQDLFSLLAAQWLLELTERITKPAQPEQGLYDVVHSALEDLAADREKPVGQRWLALYRRAWRLLAHEGFAPSLSECAVCHKALDGDVRYDPQHGFVHAAEAPPSARNIHPDTFEYLRGTNGTASQRQVLAELQWLVEKLIHQVIERPMQSESVLRSVIKLEQLSASP